MRSVSVAGIGSTPPAADVRGYASVVESHLAMIEGSLAGV
jgi:hypothetical protein